MVFVKNSLRTSRFASLNVRHILESPAMNRSINDDSDDVGRFTQSSSPSLVDDMDNLVVAHLMQFVLSLSLRQQLYLLVVSRCVGTLFFFVA